MRDRHGKTEGAEHQSNLVFTQRELPVQVDRHEIKEHPFAKPPQQEGKRDKKKAAIQLTPLWLIYF
jgi:hypothetical protein